ncbi:proline-rich protein 12-like [Perognathus longimembris pacificus]|uniref:proline-rich protein 12-like n=1 Tax=Perognathus longimembris pacificus TaxID=214514 RepID=UPI002019C6EE|nr:proline-rich protein 12-like [Perognathus longimembris pacificus]
MRPGAGAPARWAGLGSRGLTRDATPGLAHYRWRRGWQVLAEVASGRGTGTRRDGAGCSGGGGGGAGRRPGVARPGCGGQGSGAEPPGATPGRAQRGSEALLLAGPLAVHPPGRDAVRVLLSPALTGLLIHQDISRSLVNSENVLHEEEGFHCSKISHSDGPCMHSVHSFGKPSNE